MTAEADLPDGELVLSGQIMSASNSAFYGTIDGVAVIYKPVAGERPLWDFPDGNLARREAAAYLVSEAFGWNIVPRTWLHDGPLGTGMVQLWQQVDEAQDAVAIVSSAVPLEAGWLHVFDGVDEHEHPVSLVHEDSAALRRMAVFDIVANNADRKGGHVLAMADGHRYGIDHGLTFHDEHKLRTVLWGFVGDDLEPPEVAAVERVRSNIDGPLGAALAPLLTDSEITAFARRCERLVARGTFPAPRSQSPAVPWPLF